MTYNLGIPSLGILKMDPLRIDKLLIDQGSGPVSIKLDFKNLDISNLKSIVIDKVQWVLLLLKLCFKIVIIFIYCSFNPGGNNVDIELHPLKPIVMDGDYEISGKVLILPIVGNGRCKINIGNIIINNYEIDYILLCIYYFYRCFKSNW